MVVSVVPCVLFSENLFSFINSHLSLRSLFKIYHIFNLFLSVYTTVSKRSGSSLDGREEETEDLFKEIRFFSHLQLIPPAFPDTTLIPHPYLPLHTLIIFPFPPLSIPPPITFLLPFKFITLFLPLLRLFALLLLRLRPLLDYFMSPRLDLS